MTKIKICGLKSLQDIEAVNEALPEYIGLVFAKSSRQIEVNQAKEMKKQLDKKISAVGVFVNSKPSEVIELCEKNVIDIIQLHGEEDAEYIDFLRNKVSNPILKAVRVQNTEQILRAQLLPCDYLLFDTYHKDVYGGSGEMSDHSLIPKTIKPYFLAGGLNADNISNVISDCNPYCVDISSGVESDGIKDKEKIKEIIKIVRSNTK